MEQQILADICKQIGELQGTVKKGFEGVDTHFTRLNSKIAKQEIRINANESSIDQTKGSVKTIGIVWGSIVTVISLAIAFFKQ